MTRNRKQKQSLDLTRSEIHQRLDLAAAGWLPDSPPATRKAFIAAVHRIADEYIDSVAPEDLVAAARKLYRASGAGRKELARALAGLTPALRERFEDVGIRLPKAKRILPAHCQKVREALTGGGKWTKERDQYRWQTFFRVSQERGNPGHKRERVLTASLAAAFTRATDYPPVRSRGTDKDSPFETIIGDVEIALGLDDTKVSSRRLLQWLVGARERLARSNHETVWEEKPARPRKSK